MAGHQGLSPKKNKKKTNNKFRVGRITGNTDFFSSSKHKMAISADTINTKVWHIINVLLLIL